MKTADIKVGEDYAYQWRKYGTPWRVTVLETGVERQQGRDQRAVKNGVRVRAKGGREFLGSSREIVTPWADYEERCRERDQQKQAHQETKRQNYADRARLARRAEVLLHPTVEPRWVHVYAAPEGLRDALRGAGYSVRESEFGYGFEVYTRLASIRDLIVKAQVSLSDIAPLLDDGQVQA